MSSLITLEQRHRDLLTKANVSSSALSELTSRKAMPQAAVRRPGADTIRVLNWNLLADGLSDDGFTVRDVLAGGSPADVDEIARKVVATREANGDMKALKATYSSDRSVRNLGVVINWETRWARMLVVIEKVQPDVLTFEEVDHMAEAQESLRALGYECSARTPHGAYKPVHTAVDSQGGLDARKYLSHVQGVGMAFAPKVSSNARKFAIKGGNAAADDDGAAIFWRAASFTATELSFLAMPDLEAADKLKGLVRVRLERKTDKAQLYVVCGHLASGTSAEAETARVAELTNASVDPGTGKKTGPSVVDWLRSSMLQAPTLFCLDANSAPDRMEPTTVWKVLRGFLSSVWDGNFDAAGRPCDPRGPLVITSNKLRGPESNQIKKIGEHVCLISDYMYFSAPLKLLGHAIIPASFSSESGALKALLPDLCIPSDHYPVACDFTLSDGEVPPGSVPTWRARTEAVPP